MAIEKGGTSASIAAGVAAEQGFLRLNDNRVISAPVSPDRVLE